MKKRSKLTPIITGTLLVLPSFLFLSSAQKSNAMLGSALRGAASRFLSSASSSLSKVKLNTITIPKNFSTSSPSLVKRSNSAPASTSTASSNSGSISISSGSAVNVKLNPSTSAIGSVQLDDISPTLPIQQRLVLTLLKNGITPENQIKSPVSGSLSRLTGSDV